MSRALLLLLALSGCVLVDKPTLDARLDPDGDNSPHPEDCDSEDASVYPGAAEVCDGVDQNCDGEIDEGVGDTLYADSDGDGYGDEATPVVACEEGSGVVANAQDCDDGNAAIHPDAAETDCEDPVDYNCDGSTGQDDADGDGAVACDDCDDTDPAFSVKATWYEDADGDGVGSAELVACAQPADTVATGGDCDDGDLDVYPGAPETDCSDPVDYNCDGSTGFDDGDLDGAVACDDCDDADVGRYPGASEVCDEVDQDCDGLADDDAADAATWFVDTDGDGFGDPGTGVAGCAAPAGYVADATDCDDADAGAFPGADETCDPGDDDCDGEVDEDATDTPFWYADADADGFGDAGTGTSACDAPAGYLADDTDCDDGDAAFHPGADESDCADPADYNCDGSVAYADVDGDGFAACEECDDTRADVSPDGVEVCGDVDEDCDGVVDEDDAFDAATWYADGDADGYGDAAAVTTACSAPSNYVADATDCDDTRGDVSPASVEACGDVDEDCDGAEDEAGAIGESTWYADADGDGYGDGAVTATACDAPSGYGTDTTDCDDTRADVSPAGAEVCDAADADEDCDGLADDDDLSVDATTRTAFYVDADADGYGDEDGVATVRCTGPSGYVDVSTDCDDSDGARNPGTPEVCRNGIDDDCDGVAGSCSPTSGSLSAASAAYWGEAIDDYAGTAVGGVGDMNGDGYDDMIVGSQSDDAAYRAGAAHLILGGSSPASGSLSGADAEYQGEATLDWAGAAASGVGDVNRDGYDDLMIGAWGHDGGADSGGAAYLILGGSAPASGSLSSADATYLGEESGDYAGYAVAGAGDVNADGYDDCLVGAPDPGGNKIGTAYLILGGSSPASRSLAGADAEYAAEAEYDSAGRSVAGAGDVNGDGFDDFLVGASSNGDTVYRAGAAYLVLGASTQTGGSLAAADAKYTGEATEDYAGYAVAGAGDVNGDGYHDLLVGALYNDDGGTMAGAGYLILGGPTPASASLSVADAEYVGESAFEHAGIAAAGAGDVDFDGYDDILLGARSDDGGNDAGAAYLVLGEASPSSGSLSLADAQYVGAAASDIAGDALSGVGDIDADGYGDFLVGASGNDYGGSYSGAAFLVLGSGL